MLTIHNVANTAQAEHYFSQDNYYSTEEGYGQSEWLGKGAEELGLSGGVKREEFVSLLNGKVEGEELGRHRRDDAGAATREHRPGIDLTFSAPKSVSIVAEVFGDKDVRSAHEEAVKTALSYIEREAVQTRATAMGETTQEKTGNMIAAMFRHDTSRELDPQTHTHAVIINATQRKDGEWRSISNEEMYSHKMAAGALYRAALATNLEKLGHSIERKGADGTFEIAGFTDAQLKGFSQRAEQIENALSERGKTRESASAAEKATLSLATREKKIEVDRSELQAQWRERATALGIERPSVRDVAGTRSAKSEPATEGKAIVAAAIRHVSERQSVFLEKDVRRVAYEQATGRTNVAAVDAAFKQATNSGQLIELGDNRLTTKEAVLEEKRMVSLLHHSQDVTKAVASDLLAGELLNQHEKQSGVRLTSGQRNAAELVITTQDRFVGVQGYAGTGKTTMLSAVMSAAKERGYEVHGMAQSANAADTLGKETGMKSSTVERFLIDARAGTKEAKPGGQLWVVDESSLLSQRDGSRLMAAALAKDAKVVFVGDTRQLSAVQAGKPFELLIDNGMRFAEMTEVRRQETSHLKAAVAEVIEKREGAAFKLLEKNTVELKPTPDKSDALIERIVKDVRGKLGEEIRGEISPSPKGKTNDTLVITATNRDRHAINQGVREALKHDGRIAGAKVTADTLVAKDTTQEQRSRAETYRPGDVIRFSRDYRSIGAARGEYASVVATDVKANTVQLKFESGKTVQWQPAKQGKAESFARETRELQAGDKLRITRNGVIKGLNNGDAAYVKQIKGDNVTLKAGKGELTLNRSELRHVEYAYASTIHASQGKTVNATALHISGNAGQAFGNRAFYVGITRSRKDITIYTDDREKAMRAVGREQVKDSALQQFEISRAKERGGYERTLHR